MDDTAYLYVIRNLLQGDPVSRWDYTEIEDRVDKFSMAWLKANSEKFVAEGPLLMLLKRHVIPKSRLKCALLACHQAIFPANCIHFNYVHTLAIARSVFVWPGMDECIEHLCRLCPCCHISNKYLEELCKWHKGTTELEKPVYLNSQWSDDIEDFYFVTPFPSTYLDEFAASPSNEKETYYFSKNDLSSESFKTPDDHCEMHAIRDDWVMSTSKYLAPPCNMTLTVTDDVVVIISELKDCTDCHGFKPSEIENRLGLKSPLEGVQGAEFGHPSLPPSDAFLESFVDNAKDIVATEDPFGMMWTECVFPDVYKVKHINHWLHSMNTHRDSLDLAGYTPSRPMEACMLEPIGHLANPLQCFYVITDVYSCYILSVMITDDGPAQLHHIFNFVEKVIRKYGKFDILITDESAIFQRNLLRQILKCKDIQHMSYPSGNIYGKSNMFLMKLIHAYSMQTVYQWRDCIEDILTLYHETYQPNLKSTPLLRFIYLKQTEGSDS